MADERPIIIKKIKKGGHGHHGGAWKVAYADFVMAMMAFFLMLWLLSSVGEGELESLADYFTPTIGVKDQMGIGFEGGETANIDGTKKSDRSPPGVVIGFDQPGPKADKPENIAVIEAEEDAALFEKAEKEVKQAFESDPNLRDLSENIMLEQSPDGLKIQITDAGNKPMFHPGSISLTPFGKQILSKMNAVIDVMPNFISIEGHTDVAPLSRRGSNYTNWELSADRANAARRYLLQSGMNPERPKRVIGKADTELLFPDQPLSEKNRRITIILLRGNYMSLEPKALPATRDLLSVPRVGEKVEQKLEAVKEAEQKRESEIKPVLPSTLAPGLAPNAVGTNPADALLSPAPAPAAAPAFTPAPATAAPATAPAPATPKPDKETLNLNDTGSDAAGASERSVEEFKEFLD